MAGELIYAFRIMRLPLLDAGGASIGRIDDVVVVVDELENDDGPVAPKSA